MFVINKRFKVKYKYIKNFYEEIQFLVTLY